MHNYHDLTVEYDFAHKFADLIASGRYSDVVVFEFHAEVDASAIANCEEGHQAFHELAYDAQGISLGGIDRYPAWISLAIKLGGEWFIDRDGGSNYYTGYGPQGIINLRRACEKQRSILIRSDERFETWLKQMFGGLRSSKAKDNATAEAMQFKRLVQTLEYLSVDLQRRKNVFQGLKEEQLRDSMLPTINTVFKGRGNAEANNGAGRTDVLVRTKDGLNEHIFELKVWKGTNTLNEAIAQLSGYLGWHNNHAGILVFVYAKNFSTVVQKTKAWLQRNGVVHGVEQCGTNAFRFSLPYPTDSGKHIQIYLALIALS